MVSSSLRNASSIWTIVYASAVGMLAIWLLSAAVVVTPKA
jgi:hypothetical protein